MREEVSNRRTKITPRSKFCTVDGCGLKHEARGFCSKHYANFCRAGTPIIPEKPNERYDFARRAAQFDGPECLPWPFKPDCYGYGRFWADGKTYRAHVEVCAMVHGPRPEGLECAHSCGNRICVNPRHLRWATPLENTQDKYLHGTVPVGESHPRCKFSDETVDYIRRAKGRINYRVLSAETGVSKSHIWRIWRGQQRASS